ncbi:MAG: hypothetical protein IJX17_05890 [Clostridia bacterium]|nr:hypothetical protein [Clostridia bacterium]
MKKLLKISFPVKSLDLKLQNSSKNSNIVKNSENIINNNNIGNFNNPINEKIEDGFSKSEINEIKEELKAIKNEVDVFGGEISKPDEGIKLLGELLKYLRETKNFSTLMICRKIKSIILSNKIAEIDFETDMDLKEFSDNERYGETISEFFKTKSLGYKVKQFVKKESDADKLNKLLGGKLVIKHIKNV